MNSEHNGINRYEKNLTFSYEPEKMLQSLSGEKFLLIKIVHQDGGEISHLEAWSHGQPFNINDFL